MKDLDLKDFVVNYTKDDRDDVPNFILNIEYKSFNLNSNISPTSRIVLLPPMLYWYITKHCKVSSNCYTAIEMNKIHCLTINRQELLHFAFLDSWGSTGSAMLLVSVSNTVYLITGDSCFSEKLFRLENILRLGPIDELYFDGPLYDSNVQLNDIDFICSEMASIIMRAPKDNKIIILSDPGLEFILVEVMKLLRPKKKFGRSYVNEFTKNIIDQLGFGKFFTNTVEASFSARVCIYSNLTEIKCHPPSHVGCKLIKVRRPHDWLPGMKAYVKEHNTHIFSVFAHCNKKKVDDIVRIVKPGICVEVSGPFTKDFGANRNPIKIKPGKITTKVSENLFKKPYDVPRIPPNKAKAVNRTSLKQINNSTSLVNNHSSLENGLSGLHQAELNVKATNKNISKKDQAEFKTIEATKNTSIEQLHQQPACPQYCEKISPELPCITKQLELMEVLSSLDQEEFKTNEATKSTTIEQLHQKPGCPQTGEEISPELPCIMKQPEPTKVLSDQADVNTNETAKKTINLQSHQQPACLQSCDEIPPELPCITEQLELKKVSKSFLYNKKSNITIKNQINIDKNGGDSSHVSTDLLFKNKIDCTLKQQNQIQLEKYDNFKDSKENLNLIGNIHSISNQLQNCKVDNPTNNISVIEYQQPFFPCNNCQETNFKFYDTSKQLNTFLEIPANLSIQNEVNCTYENNIPIKESDNYSTLYNECDNLLSKENIHGILDQRQRCIDEKNFAKMNNNGDQYQPNAYPDNCEEIVSEHLCIAKPEPIMLSSHLSFKNTINRILKNHIKFEKYRESNCEVGEGNLILQTQKCLLRENEKHSNPYQLSSVTSAINNYHNTNVRQTSLAPGILDFSDNGLNNVSHTSKWNNFLQHSMNLKEEINNTLKLLKTEDTFRSTIIRDLLEETDPVKKHLKTFLAALNPAHRLTFIKQISDKNLCTVFKVNEIIDAKTEPKRIFKRKKNHFQNIKSCKRVKTFQYK